MLDVNFRVTEKFVFGAAGFNYLLFRDVRQIVGDDGDALVRLAAAFPNLSAMYAASEEELGRVVGPIAAARIRWFLDAPLATSLAPRHLRALAEAA